MKTLFATIAIAAAVIVGAATNDDTDVTKMNQPGGWYDLDVTTKTSEYVAKTLSEKANYVHGLQPLCMRQLKKAKAQVVNGMNFEFTFIGCQMPTANGWCPAMGPCKTAFYQVKVFEQSWTNTVQIQDIQVVKPFN